MPPHTPWPYNEATTRRMLCLAVVIGRNPGIARADLYDQFQQAFPDQATSESSVNNTLRALKTIGLLVDSPQRSGYYLTDRAINPDEQDAILVALRLHGVDLGNPFAKRMHDELLERLPHHADDRRTMAYPVEAIGQRRIVDSGDGAIGRFMDALRPQIRKGAALSLLETRDLYNPFFEPKTHVVFPLQMLYHDIAWYLLFEYVQPVSTRFHIIRIDRLEPKLTPVPGVPARGTEQQLKSLQEARGHLSYGWGIAVPTSIAPDSLVKVRVRFKQDVARFLHEVREHFRSLADIPDDIRAGARIIRQQAGNDLVLELQLATYVGVQNEFMRWVATWGDAAEVLEPADMRNHMRLRHEKAAQLYQASGEKTQAEQALNAP